MPDMENYQFGEDFGDEPAIEEQMCLSHTEDGRVATNEFRREGEVVVVETVQADPRFQIFLKSLAGM